MSSSMIWGHLQVKSDIDITIISTCTDELGEWLGPTLSPNHSIPIFPIQSSRLKSHEWLRNELGLSSNIQPGKTVIRHLNSSLTYRLSGTLAHYRILCLIVTRLSSTAANIRVRQTRLFFWVIFSEDAMAFNLPLEAIAWERCWSFREGLDCFVLSLRMGSWLLSERAIHAGNCAWVMLTSGWWKISLALI